MDSIINYLLLFGQLNQQQIDLVKRMAAPMTLKKGEYFLQAGQIARQIGFIDEGILRVCYYTNKGEEVTRYFIDEYHFVVDLDSFTYQIPSVGYIEAVTDCRLIVLSQQAMQELSTTIIGWDEIIHKITTKSLMDKINRISPMMIEDGTERYLNFMRHFPSLANRIPLAALASFLGLTQSSLSRIRRNIQP